VAVFLATYLLIEHFGKEAAEEGIWIGFLGISLFIMISQLMVTFTGDPKTQLVNSAIQDLFKFTPRVALASLLAFIIAQRVNIQFYDF